MTFKQQYNKPKNEIISEFLQTLNTMDISILGRNDGLGLISFESSDQLFYTHFVADDGDHTTISISPGLSYMKDRETFEMPSVISKIINEMETNTINRK